MFANSHCDLCKREIKKYALWVQVGRPNVINCTEFLAIFCLVQVGQKTHIVYPLCLVQYWIVQMTS